MPDYWIHGQVVHGVDYPQTAYVPPIVEPPVSTSIQPVEVQQKPIVTQKPVGNPILRDLTSALVNMGWKRMDAKATAEETIAEEPQGSSIEYLIRAVLKKVKR